MIMTNFLWKILPNPTLLRLSRLRGNVLTKRKEESQERRCALTQLRVSNPIVLRRTLRIVRPAKLIRSSKSIEKLFLSAVTLLNSTMPTECAKIVIILGEGKNRRTNVLTSIELIMLMEFVKTVI
jgi:hypothetical protein